MLATRIRLILLVGTVGIVPSGSVASSDRPLCSFEALGDLPGSDFQSIAQAVSSDGEIVVGFSRSTNGIEAFRWSSPWGRI